MAASVDDRFWNKKRSTTLRALHIIAQSSHGKGHDRASAELAAVEADQVGGGMGVSAGPRGAKRARGDAQRIKTFENEMFCITDAAASFRKYLFATINFFIGFKYVLIYQMSR